MIDSRYTLSRHLAYYLPRRIRRYDLLNCKTGVDYCWPGYYVAGHITARFETRPGQDDDPAIPATHALFRKRVTGKPEPIRITGYRNRNGFSTALYAGSVMLIKLAHYLLESFIVGSLKRQRFDLRLIFSNRLMLFMDGRHH
jgi:hypothetical protein